MFLLVLFVTTNLTGSKNVDVSFRLIKSVKVKTFTITNISFDLSKLVQHGKLYPHTCTRVMVLPVPHFLFSSHKFTQIVLRNLDYSLSYRYISYMNVLTAMNINIRN